MRCETPLFCNTAGVLPFEVAVIGAGVLRWNCILARYKRTEGKKNNIEEEGKPDEFITVCGADNEHRQCFPAS